MPCGIELQVTVCWTPYYRSHGGCLILITHYGDLWLTASQREPWCKLFLFSKPHDLGDGMGGIFESSCLCIQVLSGRYLLNFLQPNLVWCTILIIKSDILKRLDCYPDCSFFLTAVSVRGEIHIPVSSRLLNILQLKSATFKVKVMGSDPKNGLWLGGNFLNCWTFLTGHILNIQLKGLWLLFTDSVNNKKDMESHLIDKLSSRKPVGMNERQT